MYAKLCKCKLPYCPTIKPNSKISPFSSQWEKLEINHLPPLHLNATDATGRCSSTNETYYKSPFKSFNDGKPESYFLFHERGRKISNKIADVVGITKHALNALKVQIVLLENMFYVRICSSCAYSMLYVFSFNFPIPRFCAFFSSINNCTSWSCIFSENVIVCVSESLKMSFRAEMNTFSYTTSYCQATPHGI